MIVLCQGVHLLITPALDLGSLVQANISSKLIVVCRLFASAVLTLNRHCPRYAAQRHVLFTSAANILGETWSSSSDARKLIFYCMVLSL